MMPNGNGSAANALVHGAANAPVHGAANAPVHGVANASAHGAASAATPGAANAAGCALPHTPLAQAASGLDACVHCGFCLPACPTYVNLHDENDSPRGRLLLMRHLLDGELAPDDADVGAHLDRCLGCRACETACPSGVPYGHLLEATRATLRNARPVPWIARAVLTVFASPALLRLALAGARLLRTLRVPHLLARRLPARAAFPFAMLASTTPRRVPLVGTHPVRVRAVPPITVVRLEGCVMSGLFAHTNAATSRVLERTGCRDVPVAGQGCCGALHAHAGDLDAARALARRNIVAFERVPDARIVVNSAGCGAMLKEYGHLLHEDAAWHARAAQVAARVCDVSEVLADRLAPAINGAPPHHALRVTHDPPCHLMHAQRITQEPIAVLQAIPGVDLIPLADADQCCGSAGIYNLVEPATSEAVLAPKLQHIADTRAALVVSGNPGCLMQLGAGLRLAGAPTPVVHPVELLDAAMQRGVMREPAP
jgi:glycolate oxidase iron-sulfur subunit